MKTRAAVLFPVIAILLAISGCAIKTHSIYEDRKDQDLTQGNLGFVSGEPVQKPKTPENTKREIKVVEIEMFPWLHKPSEREAERARQEKEKKAAARAEKPAAVSVQRESENAPVPAVPATPAVREYTVQPNDTLQKISQKFYGTYKKWRLIYDANADTLRSPDRLRVGQVLRIPADPSVAPAPVQPEKLK